MNVQDKMELTLFDITHSGEGIGREDGMIVFVEGGIPGDKVLVEITVVKKTYATGKIVELLEASPDRVDPACPYFGKCGGCQLLHMDYTCQLKMKQKMVKDAMERIGGFENIEVEPVIGMENPTRYRNKAQYKVAKKGIGFYAKKSHDIIPLEDCLTQTEDCGAVIKTFGHIIEACGLSIYNEKSRKGYLRGILTRTNRQGENMIVIIANGKSLSHRDTIVDMIKEGIPNVASIYMNVNMGKGNVVLGRKNIHIDGKIRLEESIGHCHYAISPGAFFQVNTDQTEVLYNEVRAQADLKGDEVLFDLFCGTGTIGLYLADQVKAVYGIEVVGDAVLDARENAGLNQIENATFIEGKAEFEAPKLVKDGTIPDVVVLDPPRKGCEASLLEMIHHLEVPKVVYVSCNPSTLARDAEILAGYGYAIKKVQPIDLFPGSGHVESVCLMTKVR